MISTTVVTEREAVAKQTVAPVSAPASAPIRVIGPWRSSVRARLYDLWWHKRMVPYYGRSYIRRRYRNTWLG